jgi:hypothetical protein
MTPFVGDSAQEKLLGETCEDAFARVDGKIREYPSHPAI